MVGAMDECLGSKKHGGGSRHVVRLEKKTWWGGRQVVGLEKTWSGREMSTWAQIDMVGVEGEQLRLRGHGWSGR